MFVIFMFIQFVSLVDMPDMNPATAIVAWTTLLRHLGLATDASSTNTLALVALCKCVCIDGEDKGECVALELR